MAVLVGLDNIHVAQITEDEDGKITYSAPVRIAKAMEASITASQDTQTTFADDGVGEIISVFANAEVEFTVSDIGSDNYAMLLGKQKDSNGVVIDSANDLAPYFALGFRSLKSNGEYRMMWLYKGRFQPIDETYATRGDSADSQSQAVRGTFVKRADGKWRVRVDSDDENIGANVAANWFKSVYENVTPAGASTASVEKAIEKDEK